MSKITEKVVLQQLLACLTEHKLICPSQSAYRPHHSIETALLKITNDILLALDSGNVSLLTLLDLSAAFDTIDHCILLDRLPHILASPVLLSPGFLLTLQIEHSQSSSMTTSHKSQAFPMVCHRVLCWAQFSSSSTQNFFLTWFSVTLLSLSLLRTILSSKSLSRHRTFNLQYLLWKPVCKTSRPGCWKTNLNLTMIKQRPSSCAHLLSPFQSPSLLPSLWLRNIFFFFCQKSWFLFQRWHKHGTAHKERLPIDLL